MSLMFTITPSIKKAVVCINELPESKFPLVLSRIIQKLHLKDERPFTEDEEEKLQKTLELQEADLELVIHTCEFFLHQAAYHSAKPQVLRQQLQQLQLDDNKVDAIVNTWTGDARNVVEKLRSRTLSAKKLEDVNWRLNLQMGQRDKSKSRQPNAMLELGINNDNDEKDKEKIRLEFTHDQLYAFYNQLQTIQNQIDGLS
ncbi:unnamed protein product [Owenia fusiformis]|uniref:COMM domain-containing protein n=1 Tax=Owenia fusiformis TaxID=6347 RepID=A0A8S4PTI5_OWEFU|nr:unnamed protein product [Owenia fusiformis]